MKDNEGRSIGFKVRFSSLRLRLLPAPFVFAALLIGCTSPEKKGNSGAKFTQYYNQGEQLYLNNCSNCHQKDGTGLGRVYPPLNVSDYMETNFNEVICLMRHGKQGEIMVNGVVYNQPMPGVTELTDLEIAEIATYIYNSWTHQRGLVEVKEVTEILKECPSAK